ncbi:hypothetical protein AB6T38_18205, partial [Aliiglaciecola sp. SL4]|uniref:hypothetical protein n=1 Tax=Aliiglaciecola sp. SL4 TaxID=3239806 RepID=UPI00355B30E6
MDDLIDKLNKDLEPKSTEALIEAVNKILVSYQQFHELTTGSMLSDDKNDPYRASIMGLNFKSRFFELWLPHNIFVVATFSCVYFTLRSLSA